MKNQSLYDQLAKGLRDAVADIREKVVEEPWFGRVVNERDTTAPHWPQAREAQPETGEHERDNAADIDMDR
jgi:hypothetical protein